MVKKRTVSFKAVVFYTALCFIGGVLLFNLFRPTRCRVGVEAEASTLNLPPPVKLLELSRPHSYPVLKGIRINTEDPFKLEFIIDTQDKENISEEELSVLIKYFLAALTTPEQDLWVNLSPYEKDRIIPDTLSLTDLGKDLLGEDYILKQLVSTLTYPESQIGKRYWKRLYEEVYQLAGTTKIPINTFNKVWIVPDSATVHEDNNSAIITESKLKVLSEEDYLAISKAQKEEKQGKELAEKVNKASQDVLKEMILPEIEWDVNHGENFTKLRQMYHSLVLATWFKKKLKDSIYQYYINQNKIEGIDLEDKTAKDKIYNLYVESFKKGVYDYIKADYEPSSKRNIKRRYYSGGIRLNFGIDPTEVIKFVKVTSNTLWKLAKQGSGKLKNASVRVKSKGYDSFNNQKTASSGITDETLAKQNLKKTLDYIENHSKFNPHQIEEIKTILNTLFLKALPYFKQGVQYNPTYHHTQVLNSMVKIGMGESLEYEEFRNATILALLHDIGNAVSKGTKISVLDIEDKIKKTTHKGIREVLDLASKAIEFRLEHMVKAPPLVREVTQEFVAAGILEESDIELIIEVLIVHDYPTIAAYLEEIQDKGISLDKHQINDFLFTFSDTPADRLKLFLHEADFLFVVSNQGVMKELIYEGKQITQENIRDKLAYNIEKAHKEYLSYDDRGRDDGGFINETLFRTEAGYEIFSNATAESIAKELQHKGIFTSSSINKEKPSSSGITTTGGIDLDPVNLNVNITSSAIGFDLSPETIKAWENTKGVEFNILKIGDLENLNILLDKELSLNIPE